MGMAIMYLNNAGQMSWDSVYLYSKIYTYL